MRRSTDDPLTGGEVTLLAAPEKEAARGECRLAVGVFAPLDCTPVANVATLGDWVWVAKDAAHPERTERPEVEATLVLRPWPCTGVTVLYGGGVERVKDISVADQSVNLLKVLKRIRRLTIFCQSFLSTFSTSPHFVDFLL